MRGTQGRDHAGRAMLGFCNREEHRKFLVECPLIEHQLVSDGIVLLKYWLEVGHEEQRRRFERRINDPLRQWKLSPVDLESVRQWYAYSMARDQMFEATDTEEAPWHLIRSDDKRQARLNCIRHLLDQFDYHWKVSSKPRIPKRLQKHRYDDVSSLSDRNWVPERY